MWLQECWLLSRLAGPLLCQYVVDQISLMTETSFVGNLQDPVQLSSLVLGSSVGLAFGYDIISGLVSAYETLSAQAAGAGNLQAVYSALRVALCASLLTCAPITLVWMVSGRLLVLLGQDAEVAAGAGMYLQLTLPVLYLHAVQDCLDKHLLSQGIVNPSAIIALVQAFVTPFWSWLFVRRLGFALRGAAYAACISMFTRTCLTSGYVLHNMQQRRLSKPSKLTQQHSSSAVWRALLGLALPSTAAYCMEQWATQVLIFMSGLLPNGRVAVAATGLCNQLSALVWMVACALGAAATTRVGNQLGNGDGRGAKQASDVALASAVLTQAGLELVALLLGKPLLSLTTKDKGVLALAAQSMPFLAICFVADGQNVVAGSILKGMGRQWWGMWLTLGGWWGFGVPLAWTLAFPLHRNVPGLWGGFACAAGLQAGVQCYWLRRMVNWRKEQERAVALVRSLSHPSPPSAGWKAQHGTDDSTKHGHAHHAHELHHRSQEAADQCVIDKLV